MKTTLSLIGILIFSALMLTPSLPKPYPPKEVIEQRKVIVCKEQKIDCLINEIECVLETDSIHVSAMKKSYN